MTWLQFQKGTDSVCHGTREWVPNNRTWRCDIPDDIARFILDNGRLGAYRVEEPSPDVFVCSHCGHHHHDIKE